jgi:hypothetical protein
VVYSIPREMEGLAVAFALTTMSIIDSCQSLFILAAHRKMRDCFICARAIFDNALNIGYYSVKGEETINLAYDHALQKSYRDLRREIEIKDIKLIIGLKDINSIPKSDRLRKSLEEFTSKKGLEIRNWTDDNIYKKIELINEKFGDGVGVPFTMAFYYVYRHASEIIHGTIFGAMFNLGMTQLRHEWPTEKKYISEYYNTLITMVILNINLVVSCVISILESHYKMKKNIRIKNKAIVSKQRKHFQNS